MCEVCIFFCVPRVTYRNASRQCHLTLCSRKKIVECSDTTRHDFSVAIVVPVETDFVNSCTDVKNRVKIYMGDLGVYVVLSQDMKEATNTKG